MKPDAIAVPIAPICNEDRSIVAVGNFCTEWLFCLDILATLGAARIHGYSCLMSIFQPAYLARTLLKQAMPQTWNLSSSF